MSFDWLLAGRIVAANPASAEGRPNNVTEASMTSMLDPKDWRTLLASIPTKTTRDLRDRALIATLTYSFARIGTALALRVKDLRPHGDTTQIVLPEKTGQHRALPCHPALTTALRAYIDAANIADDPEGPLFRTSRGHNARVLSPRPMAQPDAWRMIRRRAQAAGITARIDTQTLRATGITAFLSNGGSLSLAQTMAGHKSARSTQRYDPITKAPTQEDMQRIRLDP
jgi:site-specific recombinase XerD